ncbi:K+-transporting ATPase c subunit [Hymenobacter luteus]|uniref:K+-transporting ATPase c subunit n=2 Tax=Hymenobacter TaxID=89966 RepID=A0A7W9WDE7_9BACT|nr:MULTISPECIES: DUF4834 family protein [Hymenobacter]MBB4602415.1 K+-transporting ATPase c subunit [Hymenobacter latericoloratus]MBB6060306.1 K+-transporting ATPase c subunit [Hymenobacter luteus]
MIKFLLVLLILWLIMRFVMPLVLRLVVGNLVKKKAQRFGQQFGGAPFTQPRPEARRSGTASADEVQVDYVPPRAKSQKPKEFKGGEYVDFEEVK